MCSIERTFAQEITFFVLPRNSDFWAVNEHVLKWAFPYSLDSQECRLESANRLIFNYKIKLLCWDCYGECEGIMLQKVESQIQSDLHICKLGMS